MNAGTGVMCTQASGTLLDTVQYREMCPKPGHLQHHGCSSRILRNSQDESHERKLKVTVGSGVSGRVQIIMSRLTSMSF